MPCPLAISHIVKPFSASTFFPSKVKEILWDIIFSGYELSIHHQRVIISQLIPTTGNLFAPNKLIHINLLNLKICDFKMLELSIEFYPGEL